MKNLLLSHLADWLNRTPPRQLNSMVWLAGCVEPRLLIFNRFLHRLYYIVLATLKLNVVVGKQLDSNI